MDLSPLVAPFSCPHTVGAISEFTAQIWEVDVGGRLIEATGEHPFYVSVAGWTPVARLQVGDLLVGQSGRECRVDRLTRTNRTATVYNLRVEQFHTFFVGDPEWGFSVWVHNTNCVTRLADGTFRVVDSEGNAVIKSLSELSANELNAAIGKGQRDLLKKWMDRGVKGAENAGPPPEGLTAETLALYREAALRTIAEGADTVGTQAARLKLIENTLRGMLGL